MQTFYDRPTITVLQRSSNWTRVFLFLTNEEREKRKIDLYLKDERRLPTKNSRWPGTPKSPIKAIRLPYKDKGKVRLAPHVVDASCHSTFASKAKCAQKRKERMHNTRHSMCTIVDRRNEKERFVTLLIRIHVRPTLLRIAFSSWSFFGYPYNPKPVRNNCT